MLQWKNLLEQRKVIKMDIIVIGDGRHSNVIQDIIKTKKNITIKAILDEKYTTSFERKGIIFGPVSQGKNITTEETKFVVAIGHNKVRKQIIDDLNLSQQQYITLIHPSAIISSSATIGYGTVIMPGACINYGATVGNHCIINTGAIVEHDCVVADYAHLSPHTTLTGHVIVEEGVHIGAGATIIPNTTIGRWSLLGAGSTAIKDIPPFCTAVGSPTRIVSKQGEKNMKIRL